MVVLAACGPDKTTTGNGGEDGSGMVPSGGNISIAALKAMYVNRPVTIATEVTVTGRLVSTDRWGNFYKTLCIEDSSGGIAVRVDMQDYFRTMRFGDVITVYCNTLTLGTYGGAIQLGVLADAATNTIGYIPESYLLSCLKVTAADTEPPCTRVSIPALTGADIYRYVEIAGVQFEDWHAGLPWCEEDTDTDRVLVDTGANRLVVRTSRYADFAGDVMPGGSGTVRGVVGYFNGAFQLTVPNPGFAVMDGERF